MTRAPVSVREPRPPRVLRGAVPVLFLLAVASACGGDDAGPGGEIRPAARVERALDVPADAGSSFELVEWVDGRAALECAFTGAGSGRVVCETENGESVPLFEVNGVGTVEAAAADLPGGEGLRGLRLLFELQGDLRLFAARIVNEVPGEAAVTAEGGTADLTGALRGRHVVVLLTDALHARHMSGYGGARPTTPELDRLADEGVRFASAYSQTSWTLPSVASLFTGLEQERHGVTYLTARLGPSRATLAETFQRGGYRTVALVQNGVVWSQTGLDRGFERYELFEWTPESFRELLEEVEGLLAAPGDRPLFLYVHAIPPHGPFVTPEEFGGRFDPDYAGPIDGSVDSAVFIQRGGLAPEHPDVVQFAALYDEYLAFADAELGRLLDGVRAAGREQEFAFVHLSDHGEAFMQHGALGHGMHVYEEQVRVPLSITAPGSALPAGRVVEQPVSLLDVFPTLVELCDLAAPAGSRSGVSLVPAIAWERTGEPTGLRPGARPLFLSSRYRGDAAVSRHIGMRLGDFKLVCARDSGAPDEWEVELYDLAADPGEERDIARDRPLLALALERELRRFAEGAALADTDAGRNDGLSADVLEELRALGYVK